MLIDWFTLVAQIVNFLILVWLLKRFLWGRLTAAIDERENRIAARVAEVDDKGKQAEELLEEMRVRSAEQEKQRKELLLQAEHEADERRAQMLEVARDCIRAQEAKWHEDLEREKNAFLEETKRRAAAEVLSVVRKALADLACVEVQHCAVEVFLEKLRSMDGATLQQLADGSMAVLSPQELSEDERCRIESTLEAVLHKPVHPQFLKSPAISWGIELRSNGRRIGWTPESYIESLEEGLRKALEARPQVLVG